jgi:hypothetical protein
MNIIKSFTQYSLYAILILLVLPFIYLLLPRIFNSYFDAFDKLSIPIWAALYSFFWLKFNRQIKKTEHQILIYKNRTSSLEKVGNNEYLIEYKMGVVSLSNLEKELVELRLHFDFVNEALRVSIIAGAIIKILQLVFNIVI